MMNRLVQRKRSCLKWAGYACLLCLTTYAAGGSRAESAEVAVRYVKAYQDGAWDDVVKMTAWMRERLDRTSAKEASAAKREAVAKELSVSLRQRTAEGNRLRSEGIEDVYLFATGAAVRLVKSDAGRSDLERPVGGRSWFEVTYPARDKAPRDEDGRPIRSLVVGLNVSCDGLVMKAAVLGNAEIAVDSITYGWSEARDAQKMELSTSDRQWR